MTRKKHILLFCDTFPPDLGVGGRRWYKFCIAMAECYDLTVIAGTYDEEVIESLPCISGGIHRVTYPKLRLDRYIGTFGSKPRGNKLDTSLAEEVSSESSVTKGGWRIRCNNIFAWLRSLRLLVPFIDLNREYGKRVYKYVKKHWHKSDFDLVIASHPGSGNLIAANMLKKEWGISWVADFRDPWAEDYHCPFKPNGFLQKLYINLEKKTIGSAKYVITINDYLAKLITTDPSKIKILPNSFSLNIPSTNFADLNDSFSDKESLTLSYVGCVVDKSDFPFLAEAVAITKWDQLGRSVLWRHFGPPDADYHLKAALGDQGLQKIHYKNEGNLDYEELMNHLKSSDYNVIFGYNGKSSECIYSGKVFDYISVDVPVILIGGSRESALYNLLFEGGRGFWLEDESDVLNFLQGKTPKEPSKVFLGDKSKLNRYKSEQVNSDWMLLLDTLLNEYK